MFSHETVEKHTNRVTFKDMDHKILKLFLSFIYTVPIQIEENTAIPLLMAADMYNLSDLQNLCEYHLWKNINEENVIKILIDVYNFNFINPVIKGKCMDFIRRYSRKSLN
jgi:hypothetical protein